MPMFTDFVSLYMMGSLEALIEYHFFARFIGARVKIVHYLLFAAISCLTAVFIPGPVLFKLLFLMIALSCMGLYFYEANWSIALLYAVIAIEVMQLCYGVLSSVSGMLYPLLYPVCPDTAGVILMNVCGLSTLILSLFCYNRIRRYFISTDSEQPQSVLMILTPLFMIFLFSEYVGHTVYGDTIVIDGRGYMTRINNPHMLGLQVFSILSLFCVLYIYRKTVDSFQSSARLQALEQEGRYQNQYISEAKSRYEKTRSFRHDVKNHLSVIHGLLEKGEITQARNYLEDMEMLTNCLSFPCSTGNPVLDILIGNKLGIAKSNGIAVSCLLKLPYPCLIADVDFCIILSNALDNAIHACETAGGVEDTYIRISGREQGDILLLEIENSCHGRPVIKPGTGLSNIKSICEKYNGAMNISCQHGSCCLSVMLIIPQHAEYISHQTG